MEDVMSLLEKFKSKAANKDTAPKEDTTQAPMPADKAEESAADAFDSLSFHDKISSIVGYSDDAEVPEGTDINQLFASASAKDLKSIAADEGLIRAIADSDGKLGCIKCLDRLFEDEVYEIVIKNVKDPTLLEDIINLRFGVPVSSKNVAPGDEADAKYVVDNKGGTEGTWTVTGLTHVYRVYKRLPQSDLDLVRCLLTFDTKQYMGSGAAYTWLSMYFVNYDESSPDSKGKFAPDNSYTRKNLICLDTTVAHELGHIVDYKAPGGRYSNKFDSSGAALANSFPAVTGWHRHYKTNDTSVLYGEIKKQITGPYDLTSSGASKPGAKTDTLTANEILAADKAGQDMLTNEEYGDAKAKEYILQAVCDVAGIKDTGDAGDAEEASVDRILKAAIIAHLQRANNGKSAFSEECYSNLKTRQIHQDYLSKDWFSYPNSSRSGTKISTYQFQNPGEEFAETYASYHVSNPKGKNTPQKLREWFEANGLDKSDETGELSEDQQKKKEEQANSGSTTPDTTTTTPNPAPQKKPTLLEFLKRLFGIS